MRRLNRLKAYGHQGAHIETIQCTTLLAKRFFFFQLSFLFKCVLWFFLLTCFFLVFFFTHWMPPLLMVLSFIPPGFSTGQRKRLYTFSTISHILVCVTVTV